jgi:spermidine synthase
MHQFAERTDLAVSFDGMQLVDEVQSSRQQLSLFQHPKLGLILVIDGEVQHVEVWQALYHEPLVHVSAAFVPHLRKALVLGGGSLFAARELLRYPTLESCVLVDHDPTVLALMARHYPHARAVLGDSRFQHSVADAVAYIEAQGENYDLIVNDCLDLLTKGPSTFAMLKRRLAAQRVCADVIYRHVYERQHLAATRAALADVGPSAQSLVFVPEYPGVLHLLTLWGSSQVRQDATQPLNEVQLSWCARGKPTGLEFYDPQFLAFHLHLPPLVRQLWSRGSTNEGAAET